MKIKYCLIILALLFTTRVSAQLSLENFFLSFSSSLYLDIVKTPLSTPTVWVGNDPNPGDPDNPIPRYGPAAAQSVQFSSYSFGIEPRYNVYTVNKDAAIAVAMPLSFGIGYAGATSENVRGVNGLGSIQIPLLARFYYGNSSTYDTEKDFGVSFGGGLEYNQIGLFGGREEDKEIGLHKGFLLPVASFGVHFWRGNAPFEINVKYGATKPIEYTVNGSGGELQNESGHAISKTARGSSFKLSFLYLLNY